MNALAAQLPVLPIITPFIAGALTLLLPKGRIPHHFATIVSWATFAACAALLLQVAQTGPISYAMGDWEPPIGIEYRIDLANALVLALVSGIAALVFPFAYESVKSEIDARQTPFFYAMMLICLTGMLGVTITGDAFNVFVFLEISSLSSYALVAMGAATDRRALTAAFNYLVMGTLGATFFVIGLGLLYQATGTLNMADIRLKLAGLDNRVVEAGFSFILVGIGLKLAMFPMHVWMPGAYGYAPSAVSAFIAATSTKVAMYVLIRFFYSIFGLDFDFMRDAFQFVLLPLGLAGMFLASLVALFQSDVKRMLAFSSVGQLGYMLLGLSFGTKEGLAASIVHLINHGLMKGALFMAVACVVLRFGDHHCTAFTGLARRMPWTAASFLIAGLALVGVPLTTGFVSKWYLLEAGFEAGRAWTAFLVVLSSLIALLYVGRVVELMLRPAPQSGPFSQPVREAPLSMIVPMLVLVAANLYFGVRTDFTAGLASRAAEALMSMAGAR